MVLNFARGVDSAGRAAANVLRGLIGTIFLSVGLVNAETELQLASGGKARHAIFLDDDAIPAEITAAEQLRKYLNAVTGADFAIHRGEKPAGDLPLIHVGPGLHARELLPDEDWESLGADGLVIRTAGEDIILAGGRPRGTLYAVFEFLEDAVGCRWWTPTEKWIPENPDLRVSVSPKRFVPPFAYREYFSTALRYHPEFATILRQNGHHPAQDGTWGGHHEILGFSHTFSELLPPEEYFHLHPEWYTDPANGSMPCTPESAMPEAQHTQLCLTNPEVLRELTRRALEWVRKNPDAGYISISQNDYTAFCRCSDCRALSEKEGGESGPIIHFVNRVAEEIARQAPHFLVETMAYTYSENPPKHVRPAPNVIVRTALALADFGAPMESASNRAARDRIKAWADISNQLFIWTYGTNFKRTMLPHPNWRNIANHLRFFADNKVEGVFFQGDCYTNEVGDFTRMRSWVIAKLLWDPSLDQRALMEEFANGYYGAAGPFLLEYIDAMTESFEKQGRGLNTNNRDFSFFDFALNERARRLFQQAGEAVRDDPVFLDRVRREELSIIAARLFRDRALRNEAARRGLSHPSPEEVEAERRAFVAMAAEFGAGLWGENIPFEKGLLELTQPDIGKSVELPVFLKGVSPADAMDFQPDKLTLALEGSLTERVEDPAASGGMAATIPANSDIWLVQAQLGNHLDTVDEPWRIFLVARLEAANPPKDSAAPVLTGGVFSDSDMQHTASFNVRFRDFPDTGYQVIDLGTHLLNPGMFVWFAPASKDYERVFIDRILFVRAPAEKSEPDLLPASSGGLTN